MASRFATVKEDTILAANEAVVPRMPRNFACRCLLVGRTLCSYFNLIFLFSPLRVATNADVCAVPAGGEKR